MSRADARAGALEQQVLEEVRRTRRAPAARRGRRRRPRSRGVTDRASGIRSVTTRRPFDSQWSDCVARCRQRRPSLASAPRRRARPPPPPATARRGRRHRRLASAGPRSPNSSRTSASKLSSNETSSSPLLGAGCRSLAAAAGPRLTTLRSRTTPPPPTRRRAPTVGLQRHLAVRVDVVDPDLDLVAEVEHVLDLVDALAATHLRDVEQAVAAREDVDERTELGDVDDPALVDLRRPRRSAG